MPAIQVARQPRPARLMASRPACRPIGQYTVRATVRCLVVRPLSISRRRTPICVRRVMFYVGTWIRVGTPTPTSALAGSTVDPLAMMTDAKGLPTSHYDDYSLVFY